MKKAQSWTPIYLLIVAAIAIILIITFVKPLFQQASSTAAETSQSAKTVIGFIPLAFP
jgi:type II secretory pathway component PulF